jgi:WhiB family transcriptional regulator, redox-sensing transcriptional regulator
MHRPPARAPARARLGDLSPEKTFRLKKPLKQPQNATDVITIVMFQTPISGDPDASLHRLRRHWMGPIPVEIQPWYERAACLEKDADCFFPEKGGSTRAAKRICQTCTVQTECLEYALANDERFGIWGGLSERERRRLKRRAS